MDNSRVSEFSQNPVGKTYFTETGEAGSVVSRYVEGGPDVYVVANKYWEPRLETITKVDIRARQWAKGMLALQRRPAQIQRGICG